MAYGLILKSIGVAAFAPIIRLPARFFSTAIVTQTTNFAQNPELAIPIGETDATLNLEFREDRIRTTNNIAMLTTVFYGTYAAKQGLTLGRPVVEEAVERGLLARSAGAMKWGLRGASRFLGVVALVDLVVLGVTYGLTIVDDDGNWSPTTLSGEIIDLLFGPTINDIVTNEIDKALNGDITRNEALYTILGYYLESIAVEGQVSLDGYSVGKIISMSAMTSMEEAIVDTELDVLIMYVIGVLVARIVLRSLFKVITK